MTLLLITLVIVLLGGWHVLRDVIEIGVVLIGIIFIVIAFVFFWAISANAADYPEPAPPPHALNEPMEPEDMPIVPPPMAFRPAGSPPGYVLYAPNPQPVGRCLPGFFWRVYPDGNGTCWPWND